MIATAAAALSDELFGFRAQWLWTLVFGACALVLALLGPIGFVRRFIRRFAIWAVPLALVYLTWWALDGADLRRDLERRRRGRARASGRARTSSSGSRSPGCRTPPTTRGSRRSRRGALGGNRARLLRARTRGCSRSAPCSSSRATSATRQHFPAAVVAGGFAAIVALFALLVTETDEAFANAYSAAVSLQNAVPQRAAEAAHRARHGDRDGRSTRRRLRELPELPAPARLGVRAALRGAPRRLARRRSALHDRRRLRLASVAAGPDRRLDRRVRALPVALPDRARRGGSIWSAS